ncbi:Homoserine kinase [Minicystis rosea]|nr:Homoserine kinase [Minicystis rosea]
MRGHPEPIHALPYEEQLAHLERVVVAALSRYELASASHALLQYENNAVYRVRTAPGDELVLRVSTAAGRTLEEQRSEMDWLSALRRDTDLLVPEPIPSRDGAPVVTVARDDAPEPHACALLRWVPGEPPDPGLDPAIMERVGAFTATLHQHAARFVPRAGFTRPRWDWESLFGPSSVLGDEEAMSVLAPPQRAILVAAGARVRQALSLPGKEALATGLVHADLHRDNILIHEGGIGVIDFDDCGSGYFVFDLATVLDSIQRRVAEGPAQYRALREALLRGYDSVRPLPRELDEHLRLFRVLRDMVNFNFILGSKNANVQSWGRPRLSSMVDQLQAYLDDSPSYWI